MSVKTIRRKLQMDKRTNKFALRHRTGDNWYHRRVREMD